MEVKLRNLGEKIHHAMVEHNKFGSNLEGSCAVCSYLLVKEAKKKLNLKVRFKAVYGHCWTEYDGIIYDITATQFGEPGPVLIVPRPQIEKMVKSDYLQGLYQMTNFLSLASINRDWDTDQCPKNYSLRWINQYKAKIIYKDL